MNKIGFRDRKESKKKNQKKKKKTQENNTQEEPKALVRPTTLPSTGKNEAIQGVTIKQVKEMLHSEDISQVIKLFSLMMQRDLHLAGAISSRQDQLQSLPYKVEGDESTVKFSNAYLESMKFNLLLRNLSSSLEYGFSVLDLNWDVKELDGKNYFVPTTQKLLSARYFNYDDKKTTDKEALYFTIKDKKKYLSSYDDRKMLLHLHQTDTEHITRYSPLYKAAWFVALKHQDSPLYKAAWFVALKHQVIASNMQWFDALGVPPLIINQDTADEKDLESVLYQALSLRSNAVGIFPKGVEAKILDGHMSKNDFLSFIEYIDKQVSFFITGQTLATGSEKSGSYAQAKIHENRLTEKQSFDAKLIASSITELLNLVVGANFSTAKKIKFTFVLKEHKNTKENSEVIKNLEDAGFEIPTNHIESEFGIKGVKRKATQETSTNTQDGGDLFIEQNKEENGSKKLPLDKIQKEVSKLDLNNVEKSLTERLLEAIDKAESYEEVYELLAADESVDVDELETLLAQYMLNAQMQGLDDGGN